MKKTKSGKAVGIDEVGQSYLKLSCRTLQEHRLHVITGFGRLRDGRKCGRKGLSSKYSRKVICTIVTIGEE